MGPDHPHLFNSSSLTLSSCSSSLPPLSLSLPPHLSQSSVSPGTASSSGLSDYNCQIMRSCIMTVWRWLGWTRYLIPPPPPSLFFLLTNSLSLSLSLSLSPGGSTLCLAASNSCDLRGRMFQYLPHRVGHS